MNKLIALLAVSSIWCAKVGAQTYTGFFYGASCSAITGWAWNPGLPNTPINVNIFESMGGSDPLPVGTVTANIYDATLYADGYGNGYHDFSLPMPTWLMDGNVHTLFAYVASTGSSLGNTVNMECSPGSTGYQYYYSDPLTTINTSNWTENGTVAASSSGLTATSTDGGSLISRVSVPDGTGQYEVRTTLTLTASGGTYVTYLDATSNAQSGPADTGTYYAVELQNPTFSGSACSATLVLYKSISGSVTTLDSNAVPCNNGMVIRTVRTINSWIAVYINGDFCLQGTDSSITTGQPGVGARGTPSGNSVSSVEIGSLDRIDPNPFNTQTIETSSFPTRVDMDWAGVTDNPNGSGFLLYQVLRNGSLVAMLAEPGYSDETVAPSTEYQYTLIAYDYHLNTTSTTFNVVTPPAGSVDPRRVGVRPTGAYWGSSAEQIDMLSGNLNLSVPIVTAQARRGWTVPFNLVYNSENWREDSGGTWNLGQDVGYGYGWKMLAGSLTPYWANWGDIDHYVFTDSSGAQYRLSTNTGNVWTSSDSVYVSYNATTNILYFPNGTFWVMGATSAGSEQDAGTMYPTTIEDTNGNQIVVDYYAGQGATWLNSSARIQIIDDVRATSYTNATYLFYYNTDAIPHLTQITNTGGVPTVVGS